MWIRNQSVIVTASVLFLAGCAAATVDPAGRGAGGVADLPEAVVALAAPGQNLASARLLPQDNCYWYEYAGRVETTLLPLKTVDGRPICLQRKS